MTRYFDVIICGAGPAGCTAALGLGSSGLKVALIEKAHFPRDKTCGDAIPAYVPKVLNSVNPLYGAEMNKLPHHKKVNTCRIVSPNEKTLDLVFPEYGYICRRLDFDNFLFKLVCTLSNTTVFQDTTVKGITVSEKDVVIKTSNGYLFKGDLMIGCDGAGSTVRRQITGKRPNLKHSSFAVRTYFRNVKDIPDDTYELHFLKKLLPGYLWIFPLPNNLTNVGLGLPSETVSSRKTDLRKLLNELVQTVPYLKNRFSEAEMTGEIKGSFLPSGIGEKIISGNRFMLCGDAASLINPASGAGIGQAMQSGRYAAWQAIKCFQKNNFSSAFIKEYDRIISEKIIMDNLKSNFLRKLLNLEWIIDIITGWGSVNTHLKRILIRLLQ